MEIVLINQKEDRRKLVADLAAFARQYQIPERVLQGADLALEEALTNIFRYAYDDERPHRIRVQLALIDQFLQIEVEDDGKPFDPTQAPPVDTSVPLERKPVGGLGIHLMRQFMDEVCYRRERNRNILTMRKRLTP